ncbi:MAG: hypothetical protein ABJ139_11780 [Paracoccaceae bacterium]
MKLIKFCNKKNSIFNSKKFKFGTFQEYRETEYDPIRDEDEGKFVFEVNLKSVVASRRWIFDVLFLGVLHRTFLSPATDLTHVLVQNSLLTVNMDRMKPPGRIELDVYGVSATWLEEDRFLVEGIVRYTVHVDNMAVFCMSVGEKGSASPFEDYDDQWSVDLQNADQLAEAFVKLFQLRFMELKLNNRQEGNVDIFLEEGSLWREMMKSESRVEHDIARKDIFCEHGFVQYGNQEIEIEKQGDLSLHVLNAGFRRAIFSKPKRYSEENEYRFLINPQIKNTDGNFMNLEFSEKSMFFELSEKERQSILSLAD